MLLDDSGIATELVEERGYWSATRRCDLPAAFKRKQRRAPALVIPMCSPDGRTTSVQIRPEHPRVSKDGDTVKYDTPPNSQTIIDVHPHNTDRVRNSNEPLWITEGLKKADALTSRGLPTVGLAGVWMFAVKDTHGKELLPCWEHVRLDDRWVYVVYDNDVMVKPEVALALERLTEALEVRGATVRVIYLPDTPNDSKQGVDDFLVAGGTVEELYDLARPFEKRDYIQARLARDTKLKAMTEELWSKHDAMPTTKQAECTRRAVYRALVEVAEHRGKSLGEEGIRFFLCGNEGGLKAGVSQPTFSNHANALEKDGYLRIERQKDKTKANVYVLLTSGSGFGNNNDKGQGRKEEFRCSRGQENVSSEESRNLSLSPRSPRRYSQTRDAHFEVPELRWSRVIISWFLDEMGVRDCIVDPLLRLGQKRREIIVYLLIHGDSSVEELKSLFASERTRQRDFVADTLSPMIEDFPILDHGDGRVRLRGEWGEALKNAQEVGEEPEAAEQQAERYELKRVAFRNRHRTKPDTAPIEAEMDARRREREQADGCISELRPIEDLPELSPNDRPALDAILRYEQAYGPGEFRWDRATSKKLFYRSSGHWPNQEQLDRIRDYLAATGELQGWANREDSKLEVA